MFKKVFFSVFIFFFSFLFCVEYSSAAQENFFVGIDILTGLGSAQLKEKDNYRVIPLNIGLSYDLKKLTKKFNFNPSMMLHFQLEPFFGWVIGPDPNIEVGMGLLLKIGLLPEKYKLQPYIKGGSGPVLITQHTREQSTQFNFVSNIGAGLQYLINDKNSFLIEYRYRHLSNASIKSPNNGIDSHYILSGISYKF